MEQQPIELVLYEEASKRREKKEKIENDAMMNILLNATKSKISNNSHKIAISKTEKMIDEIITKHMNNDKTISFITFGEILTELKIFRETFPKDTNSEPKSEDKQFQNFKEIQMEIINMKETGKRKQKEVNFYEQLWIIINPGNKPTIKANIVSEIIKILFAPVNSNVKDISEILRKFLITAFCLNSNPEEVKKYISPITDKDIKEDEIWSIEKLVKEFLSLKQNSLAYQEIKHLSKNMQSDLEHKTLSFKPKINQNTKGWNYFNERLPALVEREKLKLQVLEEMRKENEENDMKECSFKPNINSNFKSKRKFSEQKRPKTSIYDKLYITNKDKYEEIQKIKERNDKLKEDEELKQCTFKPQLISQKTLKRCLESTTKPKGYDENIQKMRDGIIKAAEKKFRENKIPSGENYEKVKNAKIKPFDITDLRKSKVPSGKKTQNASSLSTKGKNEESFNVQIKIPNGKERIIRVYLSDDPYDVADNFCKTYCLKEEIKERLGKMILNYRTVYLQKTRSNKDLMNSNEKSN